MLRFVTFKSRSPPPPNLNDSISCPIQVLKPSNSKGRSRCLQAVVLKGILMNEQLMTRKQRFWHNVEGIRAQMNIEGITIDPNEIWGDVRDRAPGREVVL